MAVDFKGPLVAHAEKNRNLPPLIFQTVTRNPANGPVARIAAAGDRRVAVFRAAIVAPVNR